MDKQIDIMIEYLKANDDMYKSAIKNQYDFWTKDYNDIPPLLLSQKEMPDFDVSLDSYNLSEIQYNPKKMLHSGLKSAVTACGDSVPSVRANKGCGVYPNLLNVKSTYFEDKMPWVLKHLSKDQLKKMKSEDIIINDEFKKGLETIEYMAKKLKDTSCKVFPLDLQGPVDTAHMVYGDDFFYDLYDDPKFIHHLMNLSVEAITKGCKAVISLLDETGNTKSGDMSYVAHYNNLIMPKQKGGIKFSEDTTTLLSPEQIDEFAIPYLEKLLKRFNGGYVHYCGKNPHLYKRVMKLPLVYGINFGNPQDMHNMNKVLNSCVINDKVYYGAPGKIDENESLYNYFYRCLKNSYTGKSFKLLMVHSTSTNEIVKVKKTWKEAAMNIIRGY